MEIKKRVSYYDLNKIMEEKEIEKKFSRIYIEDLDGVVIKIYDSNCKYVKPSIYQIDGLTIYGGSHWANSFHDPYMITTFIIFDKDLSKEEIEKILKKIYDNYAEDRTVEAVRIWLLSREA